MAVTLDDSGLYLIDNADDSTVGTFRGDELCARATQCVWGNIVNLGLGLGTLRQLLLDAVGTHVTAVRTFEPHAGVHTWYGAQYLDDEGELETADIAATVAAAVGTWDSVVFDLTGTLLYEDATFLDDLRAIFPVAGGRVVIVSERSDIAISGFATLGPETYDDQYLYVFDRFDPDTGIGVANPHGDVYTPGYGWN